MRRVHLLLPVHHGGKLFAEALNSVVPFASLFGEILVSVNSGKENDADLVTFEELKADRPNMHVIVHEKEMPSPQHLWKIVQSERFSSFLDTDSVLLFFHDDLFLGSNFQKLIDADVIDSATVIIGEWQITRDRENFGLGDAGIGDGMSPNEWLKSMGFRGFRFTNGSGMVVPVKVLRDYTRWSRFSKRGARFEYFLCTHKSINLLTPSIPAIVEIFQHAGQEGANVHPTEAAWDEVLYQLWLFRQGRRSSFRSASQGVLLGLIHFSLFLFRTFWTSLGAKRGSSVKKGSSK
jgi:hypothetical protein